MASEEYESNYPCLYSDSFAFLLKVAGTADYENIAIVPETITPVSVTSVHPGVDLNLEMELVVALKMKIILKDII